MRNLFFGVVLLADSGEPETNEQLGTVKLKFRHTALPCDPRGD